VEVVIVNGWERKDGEREKMRLRDGETGKARERN